MKFEKWTAETGKLFGGSFFFFFFFLGVVSAASNTPS